MALRGEAHPRSKLSKDDVLKIRELHERGFSAHSIARNFNVSPWNIKTITKKITWKHL
jgi:IS30 family transposase